MVTSKWVKINILKLRHFFPYVLISFLILTKLNFFNIFNKDIVFVGDGLQNQFRVHTITVSNFWGKTTNIAFPIGENVWNNPSLGLGNSFFAWVFANLFHLQSSQILLVLMFLGGLLNILGFYLLSSSINLNFFFRFSFVTIGSITPFYFSKFEHLAISQYYLLPIFIFVLIEYFGNKYKKKYLWLLLFVMSLISGIWWILILLYISGTMLLINFIQFLSRKTFKQKQSLIFYIISFFVLITSLVPSFILLILSRETIGESRFSPWQSEVFGGKLSDLLVSSNIVNTFLPSLKDKISPALSGELQLLGLPFLFFLIYLLYKLLSHPFAATLAIEDSEVHLTQLGLITFFYYLVGGFGNVQSTLLNLFGISPPARAWSRLSILLAIIGMYLAFKTFLTLKSKKIAGLLVSALLFITFTESYLTKSFDFTEIEKSQPYSAVKFLSQNVERCPILQIPVDTVPIPQDFKNENEGKYYYTGYIPFLIEPDFQWSFGSWTQSAGWYYSAIIPSQVTKKWMTQDSEISYCAILFDKDFANWRRQNAPQWPGLSVERWNPSYSDARYEVYLLNTL